MAKKTLAEALEHIDPKYRKVVSNVLTEDDKGVKVNWDAAVKLERSASVNMHAYRDSSGTYSRLCWQLFCVCMETGVILADPDNKEGYHIGVFNPNCVKDGKPKMYNPIRFLEDAFRIIPPWDTSFARLEDAAAYRDAKKKICTHIYFKDKAFGIMRQNHKLVA